MSPSPVQAPTTKHPRLTHAPSFSQIRHALFRWAQASPATEVNLGEEQQRQQAEQQQERPPLPEDSSERFLMDLQAKLKQILEDGQSEADREPDRGQDVESSWSNTPPALGTASTDADTEGFQALPPDDDDLLSDDELDADDDDESDRELEEETAATPLPSQAQSRPAPWMSQTPRRTVAGSKCCGWWYHTGGRYTGSHRWSYHTDPGPGPVRWAPHPRIPRRFHQRPYQPSPKPQQQQ
ncbi:hypothetical protein EI94DRAFT_1701064 [Lactarius quietus]|nr:hypothetical protein EI94DRAFT_1701064 [Lactarius quietus]